MPASAKLSSTVTASVSVTVDAAGDGVGIDADVDGAADVHRRRGERAAGAEVGVHGVVAWRWR